jgi:hypothetical protein
VNFHNAKEVVILCPKYGTDLVVFQNIQYTDVQLEIGGTPMFSRAINTTSLEHYRTTQESCCLDNILQPTESFENSFRRPAQNTPPFKNRCVSDDGSYFLNRQLQRSSASATWFDGFDAREQTVNFRGGPIAQGARDNYYNLDRDNEQTGRKNTPPPFLEIISDSFWCFTTDKCEYITDKTWNEVYSENFPKNYAEAYAKLQEQMRYSYYTGM